MLPRTPRITQGIQKLENFIASIGQVAGDVGNKFNQIADEIQRIIDDLLGINRQTASAGPPSFGRETPRGNEPMQIEGGREPTQTSGGGVAREPSNRPPGRWKTPEQWAEYDHSQVRDRVRKEQTGYESGRHDRFSSAMDNELRRLADQADARGDLPEYGQRLRSIADTYRRRAESTRHRGGGARRRLEGKNLTGNRVKSF